MYRPATRFLLLLIICLPFAATAQITWNKDGNSYTTVEENAIVEITLPAMTKTTLVTADQLAPLGLKDRIGRARTCPRTKSRRSPALPFLRRLPKGPALYQTHPHLSQYILFLLGLQPHHE